MRLLMRRELSQQPASRILTHNQSVGTNIEITQALATLLENGEIHDISDDLLNIDGIAPGTKPEGLTQLIYENCDGFNTSKL